MNRPTIFFGLQEKIWYYNGISPFEIFNIDTKASEFMRIPPATNPQFGSSKSGKGYVVGLYNNIYSVWEFDPDK